MRGGGGGPDVGPRAVARIEQTVAVQPRDGLLVEPHPLRLAHDRTVPNQADGAEVVELPPLNPRPHPRAVQILHAHQEARPGGAGEKPGQERVPQVSDVQRTRRAGGDASGMVGRRHNGLRFCP